MDARVVKTKQSLRDALIDLRKTSDISKITVTDICRKAKVSRYSFYAYYKDKYELADDVSRSLEHELIKLYKKRQAETNQEGDPVKGYENLLDSALDITSGNVGLFSLIGSEGGSDILMMMYRLLMRGIDEIEGEYDGLLTPSYDKQQVNTFMVVGLCSFVSSASAAGMSENDIRRDAHRLVRDIVNSDAFTHKQ